jgi:hypothetical protein
VRLKREWRGEGAPQVGCEASSGGAGGCFAVLQPDAHAAQYVVARDPKAAQLLGCVSPPATMLASSRPPAQSVSSHSIIC